MSAYSGALLFTALIIGGGTDRGLVSALVWQLLCLPLLFDQMLLVRHAPPFGKSVFVLLAAALAAVAVQILPLPGLASGDVGLTVQVLMFLVCQVILFLSVGSLAAPTRERMLAWLLMGTTINVAVAIAQFAASRGLNIQLLDYQLAAGFFANQNHFSSLICASIPIVVYQFYSIGRLFWLTVILSLLVLVQFAAGSAAGILLCLASILVSLCVLPKVTWALRAAVAALGVALAVVVWINPSGMLHADADNPLDRPRIFVNSLAAIVSNLPLGAGYGTFALVYPSVEVTGDIGRQYVNHAHNEYLEVLLEGGLLGGALVVGYVALLLLRLRSIWGSFMHRTSFVAIAFLLVHSLVDYPLRTVALAATFATLNALFFSPVLQTNGARSRSHQTSGRNLAGLPGRVRS